MPEHTDLEDLAQLHQIAGDRVILALCRLALKANPKWHLQPRVPAGQTGGGRWVSVGAVAGAVVPVIARIVTEVVKEAVRQAAKRIPDILRRMPKPWGLEPVPDPKDKDLKHERIGPPTQRRPDVPYVQFRNFDEFKRYAGPAGPGRQWHHIVEQRLCPDWTISPRINPQYR